MSHSLLPGEPTLQYLTFKELPAQGQRDKYATKVQEGWPRGEAASKGPETGFGAQAERVWEAMANSTEARA